MKKIAMFLAIPTLLLAGCQTGNSVSEDDEKIQAVATIAQIGDVIQEVGGEYVEVKTLMGPGTDPHLYEPVSSDMEAMDQAEVIFYNGHHLEGQMIEIFEKMNEQKPTVAVAESIPEDKLLSDVEDSTLYDPHVWFDVELWMSAVDQVTAGLIEADPENESTYESNADAYKEELMELDAYATEKLADIPSESRVLVTAHDAFNYFGEAYDMEVLGLQGISTESEYGLNDIERIINTLIERNVKAVFVESSVSEKSINAVIEGAAEKGHDVKIGGELYSDAMGEEGTAEGTYIGMFRHNIDTIVNSLK
ncbi:metal ABC transporter solute-binding protein, Zn/Mn family [Exiguobacterium qingdaonense]|uniref:metal ABC transporter solute-binding protein, Zn/Mn family n=1 Tax=Exiguobacterium qingdaonense TaxID=2751251 RepID=UPI001BE60B2D|nr:zinc ABC transporter substrate-binding protein [Exiguobacterium qingdaonense]